MQAKRHVAASEDHGIDLAPMLDFTINLLIFFIITTSFIKEPGIEVIKPSAATAVNDPLGNLLIAVRDSGEVWMDRREVELRDIRIMIERFHIERPDDTVVIIADREAEAGIVAEVMDMVRAGGITNVSIAANAPGGG
jgi:biopolymer transport protein ExbD